MSKRKTLKPMRVSHKEEGNRKALKITAIAFIAVLIVLIAILVFL